MNDEELLMKIKADGYPTDNPHILTDFVGYYLYKRKALLKEFQELFEQAKHFEEKRKNSLWNYITSTWTRFEYVLFAKDQINEIHKTPINNNSQFLIETFIYNFIITSYSLLDSLAWIINHWYSLDLDKMQITLNFSKRDKLKKEIRKVNKTLADYLESDAIQKWINYIQEYRDFIQHRDKVHVMPEDGKGYKRMVIELKPGMCQLYPNLKHISFEDVYMPVWEEHGKIMQPITTFCEKHFSKLVELIEITSKHILDKSNLKNNL